MKKQTISKLLALCMVVSMLPAFALIGRALPGEGTNSTSNDPYCEGCGCSENDPYCSCDAGTCGSDCDCNTSEDEDPVVDTDDSTSSSNSGTTTTTPATPSVSEKEPEVVETIDDVKTETNAAGQTVVTATVEVKDATASVEVSEKAVDALIEQAKAGEVVTIVAKTSGAVSAPAAKLAALVEKTGTSVNVGNSVAAAKVNKALIELAGGAELKIAPVKNSNGTISIPVTAGGKTIAPEDVPGGIDVEVPTDYTEDEVSGVNAVKADGNEVELTWSFSLGKLEVTLTVTGDIKVVTK